MSATPGLGRFRSLLRTVTAHIANVSNPHSVTAAQLGIASAFTECSATINVKTVGANALTAPGAAAQQFTPTEFIGIITAANAMNGDMAITIGTTAGGTEIAAITILTGLNTVGEKFVIHFDGLLPAIAGASALDISVTTADTGTSGTMTGILRGCLA